jgi:hypothetical protein
MFTMNGADADHGVVWPRYRKSLLYQSDNPPNEPFATAPKAVRDGQKAPGARSFLPTRACVETCV